MEWTAGRTVAKALGNQLHAPKYEKFHELMGALGRPIRNLKFLAVLAYIALAVMAFRGRTAMIRWLCFLGALGWLGLALRVAMTKQPVFLPV